MSTILLSKINIDNSTQVRVGLNAEVIERYAECYKAGVKMPPVVVFADGHDFHLGDGFHRCAAAKSAGLKEIEIDTRDGTRLDALLYSLTCNNKHGLYLSNADKRNGVRNVLSEPTWASRSNRWVSEIAEVSEHLVAKVREEMAQEKAATAPKSDSDESADGTARGAQSNGESDEPDSSPEPEKRTGKDGRKRPAKRTPQSSAGKHKGQTDREKAAARLAKQKDLPNGQHTVKCRYCHGLGQVPADTTEFPPELDAPEFHEAWARWLAERRAKKVKPYTSQGEKGQLAKMAKWGLRRAIVSIDSSIAQGYQGIFEPKTNGKGDKEPFSGIKEWLEETARVKD